MKIVDKINSWLGDVLKIPIHPKTQLKGVESAIEFEHTSDSAIDPEDVIAWLVTQPNANGTLYLENVVRQYMGALRAAPAKLQIPVVFDARSVFTCHTPDELNADWDIFRAAPNYKQVNSGTSGMFSAGMGCLLRYLDYLSSTEDTVFCQAPIPQSAIDVWNDNIKRAIRVVNYSPSNRHDIPVHSFRPRIDASYWGTPLDLLYLSEECYDLLLEYGIETIEQLTAIPHILREDSRFTSPIRLEIKTQFADWLSHTRGMAYYTYSDDDQLDRMEAAVFNVEPHQRLSQWAEMVVESAFTAPDLQSSSEIIFTNCYNCEILLDTLRSLTEGRVQIPLEFAIKKISQACDAFCAHFYKTEMLWTKEQVDTCLGLLDDHWVIENDYIIFLREPLQIPERAKYVPIETGGMTSPETHPSELDGGGRSSNYRDAWWYKSSETVSGQKSEQSEEAQPVYTERKGITNSAQRVDFTRPELCPLTCTINGQTVVPSSRVRSPNTRFSNLGVPVGAELIFTKPPHISCVVRDDINQVEYDGKAWAISALAIHLLGVSSANGFCHFSYEGEILWERRWRLERAGKQDEYHAEEMPPPVEVQEEEGKIIGLEGQTLSPSTWRAFRSAGTNPRVAEWALRVAEGESEQTIAQESGLTVSTVKQYIHNCIRYFDICEKNGIVPQWADNQDEYQAAEMSPPANVVPAAPPKPALDPEVIEKLTDVLSAHFANGYRLNSPIELARFRSFAAEDFGEEIVLPHEELKRYISACGTTYDGKVYAVSAETKERIKELVDEYFSDGAQAIFFAEFYAKNENWLFEASVVSEDMLIDILRRLFPKLSFTQTYFGYTDASVFSALEGEILRVWGDDVLLTYGQLAERLRYIPLERIKSLLSQNGDFIWSSVETFSHVSRIAIIYEERQVIREAAVRECNARGYASITDLPFGEIEERNYELSITAVHNAVYRICLSDKFDKKGKIVARKGDVFDALTIMKKYCRTIDKCSLDDLLTYEKDLTGEVHRWIPMEAGNTVLVCIDKNTYVADRYVHFNADIIDEAIGLFVKEDYLPLKSFTTFGAFPDCGQTWNLFLLESYCRRFSRKFRFDTPSVNSRNAGAVIRKSCGMDYTEIMTDAVTNADVPLKDTAVGKFLYESGYTGRSTTAKVNEIIDKAKAIRERRD